MLYGAVAIGGAIGLVASFLETIEYQTLLKNEHAALACNLNGVLSCSRVLEAWQSKVFGFPNSMLCIMMFSAMFSVALASLSGGSVTAKLRLWLQGISLFFLAFGTWFMWESTFKIRALCILCMFCLGGLLLLNWAWLRLNAQALPISQSLRTRLEHAIEHGADTFAWTIYAILMGAMMFIHFH
jgi:uncharacterized membrane protein